MEGKLNRYIIARVLSLARSRRNTRFVLGADCNFLANRIPTRLVGDLYVPRMLPMPMIVKFHT